MAIYKTRNTGMLGMWGTWGMFTENFLEDSGQFPRGFWGMIF